MHLGKIWISESRVLGAPAVVKIWTQNRRGCKSVDLRFCSAGIGLQAPTVWVLLAYYNFVVLRRPLIRHFPGWKASATSIPSRRGLRWADINLYVRRVWNCPAHGIGVAVIGLLLISKTQYVCIFGTGNSVNLCTKCQTRTYDPGNRETCVELPLGRHCNF